MTLTDLLERVEAATGPDRELDIAILDACGREDGDPLSHVTGSIDAALALVESKLPGTPWSLRWDGEWIRASVGTIASAQHHKRPDKEAALALIAAMLKALIAQQPNE